MHILVRWTSLGGLTLSRKHSTSACICWCFVTHISITSVIHLCFTVRGRHRRSSKLLHHHEELCFAAAVRGVDDPGVLSARLHRWVSLPLPVVAPAAARGYKRLKWVSFRGGLGSALKIGGGAPPSGGSRAAALQHRKESAEVGHLVRTPPGHLF